MKKNQFERVIADLESSYLQQFKLGLEKKFLRHVLMKEIWKRREAFLQLKIAEQGLTLEELKDLHDKIDGSKKIKVAKRNTKTIDLRKRIEPPLTKKQIEERSLEGTSVDIFGASFVDDTETKAEKRRAYSREYYLRRKEQNGQNGKKLAPARRFKTTPEQREYQRKYYQRKKDQKKVAGSLDSGYSEVDVAQNIEKAFANVDGVNIANAFMAKTKLRKANAAHTSSDN